MRGLGANYLYLSFCHLCDFIKQSTSGFNTLWAEHRVGHFTTTTTTITTFSKWWTDLIRNCYSKAEQIGNINFRSSLRGKKEYCWTKSNHVHKSHQTTTTQTETTLFLTCPSLNVVWKEKKEKQDEADLYVCQLILEIKGWIFPFQIKSVTVWLLFFLHTSKT